MTSGIEFGGERRKGQKRARRYILWSWVFISFPPLEKKTPLAVPLGLQEMLFPEAFRRAGHLEKKKGKERFRATERRAYSSFLRILRIEATKDDCSLPPVWKKFEKPQGSSTTSPLRKEEGSSRGKCSDDTGSIHGFPKEASPAQSIFLVKCLLSGVPPFFLLFKQH